MKNVKDAILQALAILAVAIVVGFVFNAFSRNGINPFKRPARVPAASGTIEMRLGAIRAITLEEARRMVEGGARVIDARRKADFDEGHIPGAILFDYYDMGTYGDRVLPLLADDDEIMIYCSETSCDDSELLANELFSRGFKKLFVFRGGFAEWSGAGLPVEKGDQ